MTRELTLFVQTQLSELADPSKAGPMAAYMKTTTPFYGVQNPERRPMFREMNRRFTPQSRAEYEAGVLALWGLEHREEKYAALHFARSFKVWRTPESLPLYERLIREGAWWDLVDDAIAGLISPLHKASREAMRPALDQWIDDGDRWIRRAAILSQKGHKMETDADQLFGYCLSRAWESEFFIRKAIGWALRDYSLSNPELVGDFLVEHRESLSRLSFREGARRLIKAGRMAEG